MISVHYAVDPGVPSGLMTDLLEAVLRAEGRSGDLNLVVVDDREIARLHGAFLNREGPTDVIAFPLADDESDRFLGEVYVSHDTARREAMERGLAPSEELALYAVHGLLHLLGWRDGTAEERNAMERRQAELLARFWRSPEEVPAD